MVIVTRIVHFKVAETENELDIILPFKKYSS